MKWIFLYAFLFCLPGLSAQEPRLVKLQPPCLSQDCVQKEIVCIRPARNGNFHISLDEKNGKTVVHCYGHGGSGWTTLFGSVNRAIDLYLATHPRLDTPIRVIGSGCMGLTTAIELKRRGFVLAGISTKSFYDIPSWKAGGYFGLASKNIAPEEQANINELSLQTFKTYQLIERGGHPYITQDAVKYMPVYCSLNTKTGIEDLEERGLVPPKEPVTLDFGNGVIHKDFLKYMSYFMNTGVLMQQLVNEASRLNIDIECKEIHNFDEIAEEVIFNCAGLGGKELNDDPSLYPVRGHIVTLNEGAGSAHMDYMLCAKVKQKGKEQIIYMFPKNVLVTPENPEGSSCFGVLGGTFISNADKLPKEEQEELDKQEFKLLLERHSSFFHG